MQIEQLSDHAGEQLRLASERHSEAQRDAETTRKGVKDAYGAFLSAKQARPWWKRVFKVETSEMRDAEQHHRETQQQHNPASKHERELKQRVDQQEAGVVGEQDLASWLGSTLSDEWAGFAGYRNKRGETDLVLVGPSGVWVVEVKNRNAALSATGKQWSYQKFDNYGNVVGSGPATDRKGRSWGEQASQVSESLTWWLNHNQVEVPVRTAVVLVHSKATVATSVSPGVDILTADRSDLATALNSEADTVAHHVREQIAQLIRKDHAHHNRQT